MPDWKLWRDMANESLLAAEILQPDNIRNAISRYYYASYQTSTAYLLYRRQLPPEEREAWSHEQTPDLLIQTLGAGIRSEDVKRDIARRLRVSYKKRCEADYVSAAPFTPQDVISARKDSRYIVKTLMGLLPEN